MKILVLSDTHGSLSAAESAYIDEKPDKVLFLGDGLDDMETFRAEFPEADIALVRGNCDWFSRTPETATDIFGGVSVLFTHGHAYSVKCGRGLLFTAARKASAKLALYGHTHKQKREEADGITLINPGSAAMGDYAVITAENGAFDCAFGHR